MKVLSPDVQPVVSGECIDAEGSNTGCNLDLKNRLIWWVV